MPSLNDIAGFLHWLQGNISELLQWLRTYRVGYLVGLLIAARIAWRAYRFLSLRRAKANRARVPTQPGQAAFGAMQEIVRMLEADPDTDWSKVTLTALREHLLDMDEVTLRAVVKEERVDGGLRVEISGTDRTLAAIHRIVPAHVQELNQFPGWDAKAERIADGVMLTVTSADPKQAVHIRGLGFIGLLASAAHREAHHLAMAQAG
jgi:hypothetical protein